MSKYAVLPRPLVVVWFGLAGSGRRTGKLLVPGKAFTDLPGAVVLDGLGVV